MYHPLIAADRTNTLVRSVRFDVYTSVAHTNTHTRKHTHTRGVDVFDLTRSPAVCGGERKTVQTHNTLE